MDILECDDHAFVSGYVYSGDAGHGSNSCCRPSQSAGKAPRSSPDRTSSSDNTTPSPLRRGPASFETLRLNARYVRTQGRFVNLRPPFALGRPALAHGASFGAVFPFADVGMAALRGVGFTAALAVATPARLASFGFSASPLSRFGRGALADFRADPFASARSMALETSAMLAMPSTVLSMPCQR